MVAEGQGQLKRRCNVDAFAFEVISSGSVVWCEGIASPRCEPSPCRGDGDCRTVWKSSWNCRVIESPSSRLGEGGRRAGEGSGSGIRDERAIVISLAREATLNCHNRPNGAHPL